MKNSFQYFSGYNFKALPTCYLLTIFCTYVPVELERSSIVDIKNNIVCCISLLSFLYLYYNKNFLKNQQNFGGACGIRTSDSSFADCGLNQLGKCTILNGRRTRNDLPTRPLPVPLESDRTAHIWLPSSLLPILCRPRV